MGFLRESRRPECRRRTEKTGGMVEGSTAATRGAGAIGYKVPIALD
jgi:hypothetical protein